MINQKKNYIVSACTYSPELKFSTTITMHGMT